jgi:hypothetical protein
MAEPPARLSRQPGCAVTGRALLLLTGVPWFLLAGSQAGRWP